MQINAIWLRLNYSLHSMKEFKSVKTTKEHIQRAIIATFDDTTVRTN